MDDAMAMRGIERRRNLDREAHRLFGRQRTLHQSIRERLPLEARHDEKVDARRARRRRRARRCWDDRGRRSRGFPLEALAPVRHRAAMVRQDLDRDDAIQPRCRARDRPRPSARDRGAR